MLAPYYSAILPTTSDMSRVRHRAETYDIIRHSIRGHQTINFTGVSAVVQRHHHSQENDLPRDCNFDEPGFRFHDLQGIHVHDIDGICCLGGRFIER